MLHGDDGSGHDWSGLVVVQSSLIDSPWFMPFAVTREVLDRSIPLQVDMGRGLT